MEVSRKMEIETANAIQKGAASTSEQDTKIQETIAERALLAQAITTASSSDMIPLTDNVRKILCDKGHLYQDQAEAPKGLVESVLSNLDDELHSLQSTKRKHTLSRSEEVEEAESDLDIEDEEEVEKPATRTFSPRIELDETLDQVHEWLEEIAKSHPEIDIQKKRTQLQEKERQYRADLDKEAIWPGMLESRECLSFEAPIFIAKIVDQMKSDLIEFLLGFEDQSILEEFEKRAVETKEGQHSLLVKLITCGREPSLENLLDCGVVDIDNSDLRELASRITGDSVEKILEKWVTHLFQVLPPESALRMIENHIEDKRAPEVSLSQVKAMLLRHSPIDVPTFVKKYPEFLGLSFAFMDIDELYQACTEHDEPEYRTGAVGTRLFEELPISRAYEYYLSQNPSHRDFSFSEDEIKRFFDRSFQQEDNREFLLPLYKNISQHTQEFFELIQKKMADQARIFLSGESASTKNEADFLNVLCLLHGFSFFEEYFSEEQRAQAKKMFDAFWPIFPSIQSTRLVDQSLQVVDQSVQELEGVLPTLDQQDIADLHVLFRDNMKRKKEVETYFQKIASRASSSTLENLRLRKERLDSLLVTIAQRAHEICPIEESGYSWLTFFVHRNDIDAIRFLVEKAGFDINERDLFDTPLTEASRTEQQNPKLIAALLDLGADPAKPDALGMLPYDWARGWTYKNETNASQIQKNPLYQIEQRLMPIRPPKLALLEKKIQDVGANIFKQKRLEMRDLESAQEARQIVVEKELGSGSFKEFIVAIEGRLLRGKKPQELAVGTMRQTAFSAEMYFEAAISRVLRQHNVPHTLPMDVHFFIDQKHSEGAYGIVDKKCNKGTLGEYFQSITDVREKLRMVQQCAEWLEGIHQLGLINPDLKVANALVHQEPGRQAELYVSDYGAIMPFTKILRGEEVTTYPPPEKGTASTTAKHTDRYDCWALGDMVYEAKYGSSVLGRFDLGWKGHGTRVWKENLEKMEQSLDAQLSSTDPIDRLIRNLLRKDPLQRPSSAEVARTLQQWLEAAPQEIPQQKG